jgi:ribosomal protein S18 acetylase RimI-like enzyme
MVGHIGSVAVDPPWRRQGIGERIVTFLIDEARSHGLERLELHATPGGEGIYRRLGFRDRRGGIELSLDL